jgi:hypothetical protein
VAGHDVCIFRVAVWARDTCGMATAAAPVMVAPARNLRRVVDLDVRDRSVLMGMALLGFLKRLAAFLELLWCMNRPDRFLFRFGRL